MRKFYIVCNNVVEYLFSEKSREKFVKDSYSDWNGKYIAKSISSKEARRMMVDTVCGYSEPEFLLHNASRSEVSKTDTDTLIKAYEQRVDAMQI
jgi:hypothetical protein